MVLLIVLLLCFSLVLPAAAASAPAVSVTYESSSGQVKVTGSLGNAPGSIVTVQVRNPNDVLDYLDQGTVDASGHYSFVYTLKQRVNGNYIVKVSGENVLTVSSAMFYVSPMQAPSVTATFDYGTRSVLISGSEGTTEGNPIHVELLNPYQVVEYSDQSLTGAKGAYNFKYTISQLTNGTYTIRAWGQDSGLSQTATFTVSIGSSPRRPSSSGAATVLEIPQTPQNPVSSSEGGLKITLDTQLDPLTGVASAQLEDALYKSVLEQAQAAGLRTVTIELGKAEETLCYELLVPAAYFMIKPNVELLIVTELGTLQIPSHMLSNISLNAAKQMGIRIGKADAGSLPVSVQNNVGERPVVQMEVRVDGQIITFNNPEASVTVGVPYQAANEELQNAEHLTVWYINSQGKAEAVPTGKYNASPENVTFSTTHFSSFAIAYVFKSFEDLESVPWAKKSIEVMASKGVITGVSDREFDPTTKVTRADFMLLLTKAMGFNAAVQTNFSDVAASDYYYHAVGVAKALGLAEGRDDGKFHPEEPISRQDMMVLISRAWKKARKAPIGGTEDDLNTFADQSEVSSYAVNDVAAMVKAGVVEGSGSTLNPLANTTRAEAAVLLHRIYYSL